jgi:hypothetical protein
MTEAVGFQFFLAPEKARWRESVPRCRSRQERGMRPWIGLRGGPVFSDPMPWDRIGIGLSSAPARYRVLSPGCKAQWSFEVQPPGCYLQLQVLGGGIWVLGELLELCRFVSPATSSSYITQVMHLYLQSWSENKSPPRDKVRFYEIPTRSLWDARREFFPNTPEGSVFVWLKNMVCMVVFSV